MQKLGQKIEKQFLANLSFSKESQIEQKNKKFFNKIAKYYDRGIFKGWNKKIEKETIEIANIKRNSRILDAGCGIGNLLMLLQGLKKNLKLYGIDISEEMLRIARKKLKNKAKLKLIALEKINFKDNYFDYIFSVDSFHHYANYDSVMRNFHRVLKKNGRLIVVDFNFGFTGNKIFHAIEPGNNKMHSVSEFRELFKRYKFKNIKQKRIGLFSILIMGEK